VVRHKITCLLELSESDKVIISMKFFRSIAWVLIFALVTTPALASICATKCASQSVLSAIQPDSHMSNMAHCHDSSMKKDQSKSDTEHKSCAMGAGCHYTQVTPVDLSLKYTFNSVTGNYFPRFTPSEKSVDLSPPLKPPA
jgi:hypothetical protein